jgi:hypothetical protein
MTEAQMIEVMARAICRENGFGPDELDLPHNPDAIFHGVQMWTYYEAEARAALAVIREHVTIEKETQG